ncbi:hypothetical protein [Miltoncostaea oceani]|jgi:hypothetical protein|uniref:hypothetical protein n=1 Tax=Miltoncostaea oceani TaxID=2843216 RepID=UPI001C3E561A|nr:hypothetical protein [Miltoncostaea oceani]
MDHEDVAVATRGEELLIDGLMRHYDATVVRHEVVDAPPAVVWDALRDLDLAEVGAGAPVARLLMAVRGLPEAVVRRLRGRPAPPPPERLPLVEPERIGWIMLGQRPGRELVVGAVGHFWTPSIRWREDVGADGFAAFDEPGWAAIAWGFTLRPYGEGRTLLTTECRTHATDAAARRGFLRYWRLVGPFAAYIIGLSPKAVKRHAEAAR